MPVKAMKTWRSASALPRYMDQKPQKCQTDFITWATSSGAPGSREAAATRANVP